MSPTSCRTTSMRSGWCICCSRARASCTAGATRPISGCRSTARCSPSPHGFAYDKGDIVFVLRQYERLAAHWRAVLPAGAMLDVSYEALVADPEATLRAVLGFCGLPWDARCLDHAVHGRLIRTASAWQARQPVYRHSAGAARRYAPYLGELATLLDEAVLREAAPAAASAGDDARQPHRGVAAAGAQARHHQQAVVVRRADLRVAVHARSACCGAAPRRRRETAARRRNRAVAAVTTMVTSASAAGGRGAGRRQRRVVADHAEMAQQAGDAGQRHVHRRRLPMLAGLHQVGRLRRRAGRRSGRSRSGAGR